jgi:hypothetical protein
MPLVPNDYTDHTKDPRYCHNGVPRQGAQSGASPESLKNGMVQGKPVTRPSKEFMHNGKPQQPPKSRA